MEYLQQYIENLLLMIAIIAEQKIILHYVKSLMTRMQYGKLCLAFDNALSSFVILV